MSGRGAEQSERILWIDAVRGVTISLVVLLHAAMALLAWFPGADTRGPLVPVMSLISFLGLVRMPAFFFCSGLVFSFAIGRGWGWFLDRRLTFVLWIVLVWSGISLSVEAVGLHLYPQADMPFLPVERLLWEPYGNLWFVYAVALVSALALLLRPLPLAAQHLIVLAVAAGAMAADRHLALPDGLRLLAGGLAEDALVFFMLGIWWGPALLQRLEDRRTALAVEIIPPAIGLILLRALAPEGLWLSLLVMLPMTLGFLAAIRLAAGWTAGAAVMVRIGRRSLEIFLLHQFFLAGTFALLRRLVPGIDPGMALLLLWLVSLGGAWLAAWGLRRLTGSFLFAAPARFALPGARARLASA